MKIAFAKSSAAAGSVVMIPAFEDEGPLPPHAALEAASDGAFSRALKRAGFKGKRGQSAEFYFAAEDARIFAVGAGKRAEFDAQGAEALGGAAVAPLLKTQEKSATIRVAGLGSKSLSEGEAAARIALGARLRSYRFDKYRTRLEADQKPALDKLSILTDATDAKTKFALLDKVADGVFLTRDLVSEPPNVLYPESFAERCKALEALGVKVTVLGEKELTKLGLRMLLGVGQGSARESKLVAMEWMGGKKGAAPVAFVGKGVCFDTGGISLKPGPGMEEMKWDMGGAGAVVGGMMALAGRKAKANVVGVIGLVENMPDGAAQRPGDIVASMSGQTVEILNTDAEGRLVLGDAVWWTQDVYKPAALVDFATLTGAIIISLAHEYAGMFANDDALAGAISEAAKASGDPVWRMPLDKAHYDMIKSDVADMKNIGGKEGGSSTAAAFIGRFIRDGLKWAHIDIAGMAWATKDKATCPKGGSGYGVRLIDELVRVHYEK
jgi:leucyl aminopeptidase